MGREEKAGQDSAQGWERQLADDYRDYRWRRVMEPLCDHLQHWREGKLGHEEMEQILEDVHRETTEIRGLFSQRQDRLVMLVQRLDSNWFEEWVEEHTPPKGVRLAPDPP